MNILSHVSIVSCSIKTYGNPSCLKWECQFQNIVFGLKYQEKLEDKVMIPIAMVLSICHSILAMMVAIFISALGLVTAGYVWPIAMKELLFFGPLTKRKEPEKRMASSTSDKNRNDLLEAYFKKQNMVLQGENADLKDKNERLQEENAELKAKNDKHEKLKGENEKLKAQLRRMKD